MALDARPTSSNVIPSRSQRRFAALTTGLGFYVLSMAWSAVAIFVFGQFDPLIGTKAVAILLVGVFILIPTAAEMIGSLLAFVVTSPIAARDQSRMNWIGFLAGMVSGAAWYGVGWLHDLMVHPRHGFAHDPPLAWGILAVLSAFITWLLTWVMIQRGVLNKADDRTCQNCGYDLRGQGIADSLHKCPECGQSSARIGD